MIRQKNFLGVLKNNRGVTAIVTAIMIFSLIGFAALAIDIGHLYATRNELQNIADAAALAGAGYLGSVYKGLSFAEQKTKTFTQEEVAAVVKAVALQNKAAGLNISINDEDIRIGEWNQDTKDISPETLTAPDAVEVIARRDDKANSPITTFFAKIFSINTMKVSADATAALTGPSKIAPGKLNLPFGLSEYVFPNDCSDPIAFSPTNDSCAGWHNFFDDANTNDMRDKMISLIEGHTDCSDCEEGLTTGHDWLIANYDIKKAVSAEVTPEVSVGDMFNFNGQDGAAYLPGDTSFGQLDGDYDTGANPGNTGTVLGNDKSPSSFPNLFDYFRYRDGDGDNSIWTAAIPVYKDPDDDGTCGNPNNALEILGFATIEVRMPNPPPDKTVSVKVYCELSVIEGRGGGGSYGGLKGSIPNLVE